MNSNIEFLIVFGIYLHFASLPSFHSCISAAPRHRSSQSDFGFKNKTKTEFYGVLVLLDEIQNETSLLLKKRRTEPQLAKTIRTNVTSCLLATFSTEPSPFALIPTAVRKPSPQSPMRAALFRKTDKESPRWIEGHPQPCIFPQPTVEAHPHLTSNKSPRSPFTSLSCAHHSVDSTSTE